MNSVDELPFENPEPVYRMPWSIRLLLVAVAAGGMWYFRSEGDYVVVGLIAAVTLSGFSGFRFGLTGMLTSLIALGVAVYFAPALGYSQELRFAEWFGTSGLLNRCLSIAAIGIGISFGVTFLLTLVARRFFKKRPHLTKPNNWGGFCFGAVQGVVGVFLLLGGLLIVEPYELKKQAVVDQDETTSRAAWVNKVVLAVTEHTHNSQLGPWIEKYNPFTQFPELNKFEQIQQSVQVLNEPGKIDELLRHPSIDELRKRPEVQWAVNDLMKDPEIREVLQSGKAWDRASAVKLLSHPAVMQLVDQPGFLEEAAKVIEESTARQKIEI